MIIFHNELIKSEVLLKGEFIFSRLPEESDETPWSQEIQFELEAVMKRKPMKQTVHWIYEDAEYDQEGTTHDIRERKRTAKKIFVTFDFPQLLKSAMGPDRGWDERDRPGARKRNIQLFKKTLKNLMNPSEFKQFEKSVLFLQFSHGENAKKKPLSAVLREKILEVEAETQETMWSSSSGVESEA